MGDPVEVRIHGYELTLRRDDARRIEVADVRAADAERTGGAQPRRSFAERVQHPGLGEGGQFHDKDAERPLPEGDAPHVRARGQPELRQDHAVQPAHRLEPARGQLPRRDRRPQGRATSAGMRRTARHRPAGHLLPVAVHQRGGRHARSFLLDEQAARHHQHRGRHQHRAQPVSDHAADGAGRADGAGAEHDGRGARATAAPSACNEMEQAAGRSRRADLRARRARASASWWTTRCTSRATRSRPVVPGFLRADAHGGAVHRCLHGIMHARSSDHAERAGIPARFAASKLAEGDALVLEQLDLDENEKEMLGHIIVPDGGRARPGPRRGHRRHALRLHRAGVRRVRGAPAREPRARAQHDARPACSPARITAIPAFVGHHGARVLAHVQRRGRVAVRAAGRRHRLRSPTSWRTRSRRRRLQRGAAVASSSTACSTAWAACSGFLPTIVTLFFFLSLLEDTRLHGARGLRHGQAAAQDRSVRAQHRAHARGLRLHGARRSWPARTLPSERDRKMTILLTPFMSCSAKLPDLRVLHRRRSSRRYRRRGHGGAVLSAASRWACCAALAHAQDACSPARRCRSSWSCRTTACPAPSNVGQLLWEKAKDFLERAFTVIFLAHRSSSGSCRRSTSG